LLKLPVTHCSIKHRPAGIFATAQVGNFRRDRGVGRSETEAPQGPLQESDRPMT
jgi:hypothetical protein